MRALFLFPNISVLFPKALIVGEESIPLPSKGLVLENIWSDTLTAHDEFMLLSYRSHVEFIQNSYSAPTELYQNSIRPLSGLYQTSIRSLSPREGSMLFLKH
jgi:hypothetical protein